MGLVGGLDHEFYFSIPLEMSSSQFMHSNLFQRGRLNHQAVMFTKEKVEAMDFWLAALLVHAKDAWLVIVGSLSDCSLEDGDLSC